MATSSRGIHDKEAIQTEIANEEYSSNAKIGKAEHCEGVEANTQPNKVKNDPEFCEQQKFRKIIDFVVKEN